jgi:hypothetical protein
VDLRHCHRFNFLEADETLMEPWYRPSSGQSRGGVTGLCKKLQIGKRFRFIFWLYSVGGHAAGIQKGYHFLVNLPVRNAKVKHLEGKK